MTVTLVTLLPYSDVRARDAYNGYKRHKRHRSNENCGCYAFLQGMGSAMGGVSPENRVISLMPEPAESLVTFEQRLTRRLLDFERLDAAWPKASSPVERALANRDGAAAA